MAPGENEFDTVAIEVVVSVLFRQDLPKLEQVENSEG